MGRDEVILIARTVAEKEAWPWEEPVRTRLVRRFIFLGRRSWRVSTNGNYKGRNVWIEIDDETGRVLSKRFLRR
jgi:hypothetical protein